jgi:hypothetical protein
MPMLENLEPPIEEPADIQHLRAALRNSQRDLLKAKDRMEHLTEVTRAAAFDAMISMGGVPKLPAPIKDKRKGRAEVALWVMGDWQGSKVTTSYNSEIMRKRVLEFTERAIAITEIQRSPPSPRMLHSIYRRHGRRPMELPRTSMGN